MTSNQLIGHYVGNAYCIYANNTANVHYCNGYCHCNGYYAYHNINTIV